MVAIRVQFDGKVLVPQEPVQLPVGRQLVAHVEESSEAGTAAATAERLSKGAPWQDRTDIADSSEFARQLRADVEARRR